MPPILKYFARLLRMRNFEQNTVSPSTIFFTMLHLKVFLEYSIILYIFRILLRITSPLHLDPHQWY